MNRIPGKSYQNNRSNLKSKMGEREGENMDESSRDGQVNQEVRLDLQHHQHLIKKESTQQRR